MHLSLVQVVKHSHGRRYSPEVLHGAGQLKEGTNKGCPKWVMEHSPMNRLWFHTF